MLASKAKLYQHFYVITSNEINFFLSRKQNFKTSRSYFWLADLLRVEGTLTIYRLKNINDINKLRTETLDANGAS